MSSRGERSLSDKALRIAQAYDKYASTLPELGAMAAWAEAIDGVTGPELARSSNWIASVTEEQVGRWTQWSEAQRKAVVR